MSLEHKMIEPFEASQVRDGKVSFGVSSYGYDFRISDEFKIPDPSFAGEMDPKGPQDKMFKEFKGDMCVIPPGSFVLARTLEYFRIPRNAVTICFGKSTYARCGLIVNVTPFEPEWEGFATISIINPTGMPVKIHANEGIGQLLFLVSDVECEVSYADKKGKYQAQKAITHSKL
jgi:dCTP deaminase